MDDPRRPYCVIVDRDGTLASVHNGPEKGAGNEDWAAYNAAIRFDRPVVAVVDLLRDMQDADPDLFVLVVSGRMEGDHPGDRRRRWAMQDWIDKHDIPCDFLFMRQGGDKRVDSAVKEEILLEHILPFFTPILAIDDRPQVIAVWEKYDIPVIRVVNPAELPMIGE